MKQQAKVIEKSRVLHTKDYKLFTYEKDRVFRKRVDLLKLDMKEKNLSKDLPIIVDNYYKIIDGRHRFIASVELSEPIYYKIAEVADAIDLLKASRLTRKPQIIDFLLAHKAKKFYQKAIEYNNILPYKCEDILEVVYEVSLHHSSRTYKSLIDGDLEYKKEYDFKVSELDILISRLYDKYGYFHNSLADIESFITDYSFSSAQAIQVIEATQHINSFFDLYKRGHPDTEDKLFEFINDVEYFEKEEFSILSKEKKSVRRWNGDYEDVLVDRYPQLVFIKKFYQLDFEKAREKSTTE